MIKDNVHKFITIYIKYLHVKELSFLLQCLSYFKEIVAYELPKFFLKKK